MVAFAIDENFNLRRAEVAQLRTLDGVQRLALPCPVTAHYSSGSCMSAGAIPIVFIVDNDSRMRSGHKIPSLHQGRIQSQRFLPGAHYAKTKQH